MKIDRIVLCYPDMDRIIVEKEENLKKFDLSKVSALDVTASMTLEEFHRFRAMDQYIVTASAGAAPNDSFHTPSGGEDRGGGTE